MNDNQVFFLHIAQLVATGNFKPSKAVVSLTRLGCAKPMETMIALLVNAQEKEKLGIPERWCPIPDELLGEIALIYMTRNFEDMHTQAQQAFLESGFACDRGSVKLLAYWYLCNYSIAKKAIAFQRQVEDFVEEANK